jgi:hypothetical protein
MFVSLIVLSLVCIHQLLEKNSFQMYELPHGFSLRRFKYQGKMLTMIQNRVYLTKYKEMIICL